MLIWPFIYVSGIKNYTAQKNNLDISNPEMPLHQRMWLHF